MNAVEADVVQAEAADDSAVPLLRFKVRVQYQPNLELVLHVAGELFTAHDVFLSRLEEVGSVSDQFLSAKSPSENYARTEYVTTLTAQLDDAALKVIERERESSQKRDVWLRLRLYVTKLLSKASITNIHLVKLPPGSAGLRDIFGLVQMQFHNTLMLPLYYNDPSIAADRPSDGWLISGGGDPVFLALRKSEIAVDHKIPASDWVHDFKPRMKLGKYLVVELPEPLDPALGGACFEYLQQAREAFDMWNTDGVYAGCRKMAKCLDSIIKEKAGVDSFLYKERWGRATFRFAEGKPNWASFSLHSDELKRSYRETDIILRRADAEVMLISAEALFKYAMELLKEIGS
jgi:hypothetical protein